MLHFKIRSARNRRNFRLEQWKKFSVKSNRNVLSRVALTAQSSDAFEMIFQARTLLFDAIYFFEDLNDARVLQRWLRPRLSSEAALQECHKRWPMSLDVCGALQWQYALLVVGLAARNLCSQPV